MAAFYFDSSGVVKRFISEKGSAWTLNLFKPSGGNRIYIARMTPVEVVSAITRRKNTGSLTAAQAGKAIQRFERGLSGRYVFVEIRAAIVDEAMRVAKTYGLRGYDAVQLAAALSADRERLDVGASALTFVSADSNLNNAATVEGLIVENPNNHP